MSNTSEPQVGLVGAGLIAGALARGWDEPVLCTDSGSGRAVALVEQVGGRVMASNRELIAAASIVILAHQAERFGQVASELADGIEGATVVSLLGPVGLDALQEALPGAHVVRALVTPGVEARAGVTVLAAPPDLPAGVLTEVRARFDRLGPTLLLPDDRIDAANVIGAMFPAYLALVVEAQVDAAIRVGLGERDASELVLANLKAGAAHLEALDGDTVRLRRSHSTPGGMTVRGLEALERAGLRAAFVDAAVNAIGERPPGRA